MVQPFDSEDDPGWPRILSAFVFLVPGALQRQIRKPSVDGLFMLRQAMEAFSASLVLFGVLLAFTSIPSGQPFVWLAVLAVIAIVSIVLTRRVERPLDCTSPTTLSGSYKTRFFLRVAFAEMVALFGFTFAFVGRSIWIYYAGAAFTLVRFWIGIAPTRTALAEDQQRLNERGCRFSLIASLRGAPTAQS
jgi:hypothetical protein